MGLPASGALGVAIPIAARQATRWSWTPWPRIGTSRTSERTGMSGRSTKPRSRFRRGGSERTPTASGDTTSAGSPASPESVPRPPARSALESPAVRSDYGLRIYRPFAPTVPTTGIIGDFDGHRQQEGSCLGMEPRPSHPYFSQVTAVDFGSLVITADGGACGTWIQTRAGTPATSCASRYLGSPRSIVASRDPMNASVSNSATSAPAQDEGRVSGWRASGFRFAAAKRKHDLGVMRLAGVRERW